MTYRRGRRKKTVRRLKKVLKEKKSEPVEPKLADEKPAPVRMKVEVACVCGQLLKLRADLAGRKASCPDCGRRFVIALDKDANTGDLVVAPVFIQTSEPDEPAVAEEPVVGADTTSVHSSSIKEPGITDFDESTEVADDDPGLIPQPPSSIYFICPCGEKLLASKEMYDRRVKCPKCAARLLITLIYDSVDKRHDIQPVRLKDDESGDTALLDKV